MASAPDASASVGNAPAAFVTETMAELYLQQGFREEALHVYRQLLEQDPRDPTLRERVQQLEREVQPTPTVAAANTSASTVTSTTPPPVTAAVTEAAVTEVVVETVQSSHEPPHESLHEPTRGRTVRDFFSALATRRFGAPLPQPTTAAPAVDADVASGASTNEAPVETVADAAHASAHTPSMGSVASSDRAECGARQRRGRIGQ